MATMYFSVVDEQEMTFEGSEEGPRDQIGGKGGTGTKVREA